MSEKRIEGKRKPHIHTKDNTAIIMTSVIIALLPAAAFGIWNFGWYAAAVIGVAVVVAVLTEGICGLICKKPSRIKDMSAVVTGLLFALVMPPNIPLWVVAIGVVFAIVVVKTLFGGLGKNIFNPALGGKCFVLLCFYKIVSDYTCELYPQGTPLSAMEAGESVSLYDMVVGTTGGSIGTTSMVAIVLGACFLIARGVIDLRIPGSMIVSFLVVLTIFGGHGFDWSYLSAHLAGGGVMLGAFFLATDTVTSPINTKGQFIYGVILGIVTGILRLVGMGEEAVVFAVLLGNLLVPLIEKITLPKGYGKRGKKNAAG